MIEMTTHKLLDIAEINVGYSFKGKAESESDPEGNGLKLLQIKDIREGMVESSQNLPYANFNPAKVKGYLESGSLLIPLRGDRHAATLLQFNSNSEKVITTNQVAIIRPIIKTILPSYLLWYLNSLDFKSKLSKIKTGSTISNIRLKPLKDIEIPIPSLAVQKKVSAIYSLWKEEENILKDLLENGARLTEAACLNKLVKE